MAEFEKGVAVLQSTNKNYSSEDKQSAMEIENKLDTNTNKISIQTAIHEYLLVDILSRLPTKYLTRCNCVSKLWNRSFTKKAFLLRHSSAVPRNIIQPNKLNLFFRHNSGLHLFSFDFPACSIMNEVEVQGQEVTLPRIVEKFRHFSNSIDGLVCLFGHYNGSSIYIMSLRTLDYILLPETAVEDPCSTLLLWCSLGYDPISKEYKVARAISRKYTGKENNQCNNTYDILTLASLESWKPIQHDRVPSRLREGSITFKLTANSFCLDGITYWMQINQDDSTSLIVAFSVRGEDTYIRAFDLEQVVGHPSSYRMDYYLTHLKGCPTFFYKKRGSDEIHQSTLLDHTNPNSTWRKMAIVNLELSSRVFPCRGLYVGGTVIISSTKWTAWTNHCSDLVNGAYLLPKLDGIYIWNLHYSGFEKLYEVKLIINSVNIVRSMTREAKGYILFLSVRSREELQRAYYRRDLTSNLEYMCIIVFKIFTL